MNLQLKDKVVLITGGAKGIGAASAQLIGEEGGIPVMVDRDTQAGEGLRDRLRHAGMRCVMIGIELNSAPDCSQAVEHAVQEFGQLDALINNAGFNDRISLEHGSPEQYLGSLKKNLLHYYSMAHYAPSRPGEFRPEPLTEPDVNLSIHPARATPERLPPCGKTMSSSGFPLTPSRRG